MSHYFSHILACLFLCTYLRSSLQECPEEFSEYGITVKWEQTSTSTNVESKPLCYMYDSPVTRNCTGDEWDPPIEKVGPCMKVVMSLNTSCPPNFYRISDIDDEYCYQYGSSKAWDFPCFSSGGASVITDLDEEELNSLISSLRAANISRFYWLPAHRPKLFNPVIWTIPGPNWGVPVEGNAYLSYNNLIWKNCMALDIEQRILVTDSCQQKYPSLCFYINSVHYPALCPKKDYHAFRYKPDIGTCYGIEKSGSGLSYSEFQEQKCKTPMSDNQFALSTFIFTKIAELNQISTEEWCWFKIPTYNNKQFNENGTENPSKLSKAYDGFEGIINGAGILSIIDSSTPLHCMACESDVIYGETELVFEYNEVDKQIYLTVYFPSGLWKYDYHDKGIQCFSDAKGFVKVVDINDEPFLTINDEIENHVEKVVYNVNLITEQSAQYWCEGHTVNFSLIATNKIVVNPKGKETHVFALTLQFYNATTEIYDQTKIDTLLSRLTDIFNAQKVIWMDVYEINYSFITVLLHIHATVENKYDNEALNIQECYDNLKDIALVNLSSINSSFVSLKSCLYCLPTTSNNTIVLNWELTPIGHMTAPNEFCLQPNGLPVQRQCIGSYLNGGDWGDVKGRCDFNYSPTETTTFLYSVGKGQAPTNYTTSFLTTGLEFVLTDIDIIIPADIYYLSMSLQQILHLAQTNESCVEMGDIDNMAWVMDRVMEFNNNYLRLSQTLNSTNVILNSVNDIIEIIAKQTLNNTEYDTSDDIEEVYKIAIKPQFVVQVSYPMFTNITGIALVRKLPSEKFTEMTVHPLYANTTLVDVLNMDGLEIASWLPYKLLNSLKPNTNETDIDHNNLHVIISVFQNDAVFQELVSAEHKINSRIIGISVPGYISNFDYPLPIIFRELMPLDSSKHCSFWDFELEESTMTSGLWKNQGCYPVQTKENMTVCECYHLTHFSQLITIPSHPHKKEHPNSEQHTMALNIITLVGCFLSLAGIVGIWITAIVFANWRKKAGTKVLLQLSSAIALPLIFIVIFNLDNSIFVYIDEKYVVAKNMRPLCIVLGSLLHYSILASFMWMLITAILQFIRYVRVLGVSRPSRFMFKFCLIGWGIPLIPVIIVLSIDVDSYIPESSSIKKICYPKEYYFVVSVLVPICLILFVNIILFLLVLHSISRSSNEKTKITDFDLVGAQLRLSIFLFFLLGLTWIFGIFSFSSSLLWSYLFCLSSTLQGFILFIYFIICDPTTRNMWMALVKPPFMTSSSRDSITSLG